MSNENPIQLTIETAEQFLYRHEKDSESARVKERLLKEMGRKIFLSNELVRKSKLEKPSKTSSRIKMYLFKQIKPIENFSLFYRAEDGQEVMYSLEEIYAKVPEEARTYIINVGEYCKENGITKGGKNYQTVRNDIKYLYGDALWIPMLMDDNPKKRILKGWIEKAVDNGDGNFAVTISKELIPYLYIDTSRGNFMEAEYWNGQMFNNCHSVELYLFLKSYINLPHKPIKVSIEQLKDIMGVNSNQYTDTTMFIKRCIEPCVKDINQHTDIFITSYCKYKTGNKITHIEFDFFEKSKQMIEAHKINVVEEIYQKTYTKKSLQQEEHEE